MKAKKFGLVFGEELEKSRKRRASVSSKDLKFAESWGGPTEEKEKSKFEVSAWRLVPIYFIFFDPSGLSKSKREQALSKLLSILGDSGDMAQKFNEANDKPVTLMGSLPAEKALVIEAEGGSLPGIQLEINPILY